MTVDVGDVLLVKYRSYDGDNRVGIFVVYYHESYTLRRSEAFVALKICSNPEAYQIELKSDDVTFLDHTSYINCCMPFRFIESQVIDKLGTLPPHILGKLRTQMDHFHKDAQGTLATKAGRSNIILKGASKYEQYKFRHKQDF